RLRRYWSSETLLPCSLQPCPTECRRKRLPPRRNRPERLQAPQHLSNTARDAACHPRCPNPSQSTEAVPVPRSAIVLPPAAASTKTPAPIDSKARWPAIPLLPQWEQLLRGLPSPPVLRCGSPRGDRSAAGNRASC